MKRLVSILSSTYFAYICVIFFGAWLELRIESQSPAADIVTYADALWWALNVSSVGDASFSLVTNAGRLVGAALILIGYALFTVNVAVLSAAISHWLHKH